MLRRPRGPAGMTPACLWHCSAEMATPLALLVALAYGSSHFAAGVASRRVGAGPVTLLAQGFGAADAVSGGA